MKWCKVIIDNATSRCKICYTTDNLWKKANITGLYRYYGIDIIHFTSYIPTIHQSILLNIFMPLFLSYCLLFLSPIQVHLVRDINMNVLYTVSWCFFWSVHLLRFVYLEVKWLAMIPQNRVTVSEVIRIFRWYTNCPI